jgi:CHAD domain-containing protein
MNEERELKALIGPEFEMPEIGDLFDSPEPTESVVRSLSARYFDTDDLRLARWGCTLRYRDDEGWTLKLPMSGRGGAGVLVRSEIYLPGPSWAPPSEALDVVSAFTRGAKVTEVARLDTRRRATAVVDSAGRDQAEIVEDEVEVSEGGLLTTTFNELEIEVRSDVSDETMEALGRRIQASGASLEDTKPKLVRALGGPASAPPDVDVPSIGDEATAREVMHHTIAKSVRDLILHLPVARLGHNPEGVHQARVATRRLRSAFSTFGLLLDVRQTKPLSAELKWLGATLGAVRDYDVLSANVERIAQDQIAVKPGDIELLGRILSEQRQQHRSEMLAALASPRLHILLDALVVCAADPQTAPQADDPAREVLAPVVRRRWRRLDRKVQSLGKRPRVEDLHRVRILAKRCRYAAEAVRPAFGKPARDFAKGAAQVQDALGELNDAQVATVTLRHAVEGQDSHAAYAAGQIAGIMDTEAIGHLNDWQSAWASLSRKKRISWF